jgi:hypothetical protein
LPDLDQIKQGEEGMRDQQGRFANGRSGNPAGRPRGYLDHVNRGPRLLLAGAGEALSRKAVHVVLAGDPAAFRLCLQRIVGPYRERAGFGLGSYSISTRNFADSLQIQPAEQSAQFMIERRAEATP